jgi:hypothetical protein
VAFILYTLSGLFRWNYSLFLALVALALLCGCQGASGVSTSLLQEKDTTFKRIAILPFQNLSAEEAARNAVAVTMPASALKTKNDPETPERIIEDLFWEGLAASKKFDLVSSDRAGGILEQVISTSFKTTLSEAVQKVGAELEADGVVVAYVYRFRERRGYDYTAEKPASVFFEIQLFRSHDGIIVWKGIFDMTQTSLMENMFRASYFVKDRGRWITAKELAKEGMEDTLKKFPGLP